MTGRRGGPASRVRQVMSGHSPGGSPPWPGGSPPWPGGSCDGSPPGGSPPWSGGSLATGSLGASEGSFDEPGAGPSASSGALDGLTGASPGGSAGLGPGPAPGSVLGSVSTASPPSFAVAIGAPRYPPAASPSRAAGHIALPAIATAAIATPESTTRKARRRLGRSHFALGSDRARRPPTATTTANIRAFPRTERSWIDIAPQRDPASGHLMGRVVVHPSGGCTHLLAGHTGIRRFPDGAELVAGRRHDGVAWRSLSREAAGPGAPRDVRGARLA